MKSLFRRTAASAGLLILLTLGSALPSFGQTEEGKSPADYAILIVGDENDAEMLRREASLIRELGKSMGKKKGMSLFSYHFNKDRERQYCEKKLNVLKEDLLFIGIVSLKDKVPRRVLYRLDRLTNPTRSANDIATRADEILVGLSPQQVSTAVPAIPDATGTPAQIGKWRVQLGVFTQEKLATDLIGQLKQKGYDAKIEKFASDSGNAFRVWTGLYSSREDAQQSMSELQKDGFEKGILVELK